MDQLLKIFENQRSNKWRIAQSSADQRIFKLKKLREVIFARQEEIRNAIYKDMHKHPTEVDALEIMPVIVEINHCIKHLNSWMKPTTVRTPIYLLGTKSYFEYRPKGQVLVLSPWNYPFSLGIIPLVTAVAAGNCVIYKSSAKAPKTAKIVQEIITDVYNETEIAVVVGDDDLGNKLLDLPFDHIFFTGSTHVGKHIMKKAAEHLTSVTLELGGKSPTIIDQTADLKTAAERIVWAKLINGGQTCIAPDYVLIDERILADFIEYAKKSVQTTYGKNDNDRRSSTSFCRIITEHHTERLKKLIDEAVAKGAKIEIGGEFDINERYISPTILTNVSPDSLIMQEEIFGPILPVLTYKTLDEAIAFIQKRSNPLALYIFSKNKLQIEKVLGSTSFGSGCLNYPLMQAVNPNLPFGGIGHSGIGQYHGKRGFIELSHARSILKTGKFDLNKFMFPPYTKFAKYLVNTVMRYFC